MEIDYKTSYKLLMVLIKSLVGNGKLLPADVLDHLGQMGTFAVNDNICFSLVDIVNNLNYN